MVNSAARRSLSAEARQREHETETVTPPVPTTHWSGRPSSAGHVQLKTETPDPPGIGVAVEHAQPGRTLAGFAVGCGLSPASDDVAINRHPKSSLMTRPFD